MIILDTNVVSEPLREMAEPRVIAWLNAQPFSSLWLTSITAAELLAGIYKLPVGKKRLTLQTQITAILDEDFFGRILAFDLDAAPFYGEIVGPKLRTTKDVQTMDYQIAAIARVHGATVATRNIRHFEGCGVDLVDPWTA